MNEKNGEENENIDLQKNITKADCKTNLHTCS